MHMRALVLSQHDHAVHHHVCVRLLLQALRQLTCLVMFKTIGSLGNKFWEEEEEEEGEEVENEGEEYVYPQESASAAATAEWLRALESLPSLSSLALNGVAHLSVKATASSPWCHGLAGAIQLTHLHLTPDCVTDKTARHLASTLTGLRSLTFKDGKQLKDRAMKRIADRLLLLTKLDVSGTGCTDVGVAAIAAHLTGLCDLSLRHCDGVTGAGVQAMVQGPGGLQHLTRLDLLATCVTVAGLHCLTGLLCCCSCSV